MSENIILVDLIDSKGCQKITVCACTNTICQTVSSFKIQIENLQYDWIMVYIVETIKIWFMLAIQVLALSELYSFLWKFQNTSNAERYETQHHYPTYAQFNP